jgi:hypothetical protein
MGRRSIIEKTRVYIECTDAHQKVKAFILNHTETEIKVELPSGAVMELVKKHKKGSYTLQLGMLEFACNGKLVV